MKEAITNFIRLLGGLTILVRQIFREVFTPPYNLGLLADQIYQIGIRSGPLVFVTSASTGMVMALQFGLGLEKFGGKMYVPKIVSLSIIRELGPAFTCLVLAARIGAGITSELGSMTVTQQVDAIRALGTSPIKKIVIPRVLAALIAIPLLIAFANMIGILGGLVVGVNDLRLDPLFYIQKVFATVTLKDYFAGFCKTPVFAVLIALTGCYYGLNVKGGTQAVGNATTRSVVVSSIFILIGDYFLTKLFWVFEQWL